MPALAAALLASSTVRLARTGGQAMYLDTDEGKKRPKIFVAIILKNV